MPLTAVPSLSELFRSCLSALSQLISQLQLKNNINCNVSTIENDLGKLRAWANSTGAHRNGRVSLDYRLRHADDLFASVSVLLKEIADSSREIYHIAIDPSRVPFENQTFNEDSSSSSDESLFEIIEKQKSLGVKFVSLPKGEVEQHLSHIRRAINHLYILSAAFTKPAPANRFLKSERIDKSYYEFWDIKNLEAKFPSGDRALVERLGKANTRRRQIIEYLERHHRTVANLVTPAEPTSKQATQISSPKYNSSQASQAERSFAPTVPSQTTLPTINEVSKPSQSSSLSFEEDVISEQTSVVSSQVEGPYYPQVPPLPETDDNDTIICPYCHEIMKIKTESIWRKHVYEDLQAYSCTHTDCRFPNQLFSNRRNWYQHEIQNHMKTFVCSDCKERFSNENTFENHILLVHEADPDQVQILLELCQETQTNVDKRTCLLCTQDIQDYRSHMSHHLQDIALFVLPRDFPDKENEEDVGSNQAQQIRGNTSNVSIQSDFDTNANSTLSFESEMPVPDVIFPEAVEINQESNETPTHPETEEDDPSLISPLNLPTKIENEPPIPDVKLTDSDQGSRGLALSFIFVVNSVSTNEDPRSGGLPPEYLEGRWVPPSYARGFYRQEPGSVFRWHNGSITRLDDYTWYHMPIEADARNTVANGIVADSYRNPLTRYNAATVFYANPFINFRIALGDMTARDLYKEGDIWHHLRFHHIGLYRDISFVDFAGSEDYISGSSTHKSWHGQLLPEAYDCQEEDEGHDSMGLTGHLSILIALIAFSCSVEMLDNVLLRHRCWINRKWYPHNHRTGRRDKRGMVVHVYLDPKNQEGSTIESLRRFENADDGNPIFF